MLISFLKFIGRPLFRVLFSVEYHGIENVPETGPIIIAGNHPSYLDPLLVVLKIKRTVRYMAWDQLFKIPLLGQLIKALGAFPVDVRKGKGDTAFREALRVLEKGQALGIFPEGQRSERGPMGELRAGTARLSIDSGAPIVPVTIGGAYRAGPKWRLLPKPAKIVVRFHKPIILNEEERIARRDDKNYHRELMDRFASTVNKSLIPALRGAETIERWYHQPPSNIRSFEWAPLIAAIVTSFIAHRHRVFAQNWNAIWLIPIFYYVYLVFDLALLPQARITKWFRNSMPVWLILVWHYPLTQSLGVVPGDMNELLALAVIAAFFAFFWEDYYTLQKFVRGLVVVYYFSLALLLRWPQSVGMFVAALGFIAIFSVVYKTIYYPLTVGVMLLLIAVAVVLTGSYTRSLLVYPALSLLTLGYLQMFIKVAYDIRRAGNVSLQHGGRVARQGNHGNT